MKPARPSGADIDPVSATVYGPNRVILASGEQNIDSTTPWIVINSGVPIKSPRGMFGWELEALGKAQSTSTMIIEVRIEGGGDQYTSDMVIVHMNIAYQIVGKRPTDWRRGLVPYQVMTTNDFNIPN